MKNKTFIHLLQAFIMLFALSCSNSAEPINYGMDACAFCRMTIVDRQHAAEIVTVKGRAYKYDAIECMMNDFKNWDKPEVELFLVNDYSNPGALIDARSAHFLISETIPSPMGEFLTAFSDSQKREPFKSEEGITLDWDHLNKKYLD